ncbi:RimI Acetyltransferases [Rhabdaerophilaceae bacterium]
MVAIRRAEPTDLPVLLALLSQLSDRNSAPEDTVASHTFAAMLAQPGLSVFLAEMAGRVVGTITLVLVPNLTRGARPFGIIENVVTDQAMRGRGVGKALIAHGIAECQMRNAYKVMLMTGRTDAAALGFYRACGFVSGAKTAFEIRFDA